MSDGRDDRVQHTGRAARPAASGPQPPSARPDSRASAAWPRWRRPNGGRPVPITTASGGRDVPQPRQQVWRALTALAPYCPVCDVSYVIREVTSAGTGTTFFCVSGRLDDRPPPEHAPRAEIIEWAPPRLIVTRLQLVSETWTTRVHLGDDGHRGTRVTFTVTYQPVGGNRLMHWLQRASLRRLVQTTVDAELAKLPAHLTQAAPSPPDG